MTAGYLWAWDKDAEVWRKVLVDDEGKLIIAAAVAGDTVIWKDASASALTDLNRNATIDWTDLDLTAHTSADAKIAMLKLTIGMDSVTPPGNARLLVRKNGTTPDRTPEVRINPNAGDTAGAYQVAYVEVGLDAGQVMEYTIIVAGTIQVDSYIDVLGYIE